MQLEDDFPHFRKKRLRLDGLPPGIAAGDGFHADTHLFDTTAGLRICPPASIWADTGGEYIHITNIAPGPLPAIVAADFKGQFFQVDPTPLKKLPLEIGAHCPGTRVRLPWPPARTRPKSMQTVSIPHSNRVIACRGGDRTAVEERPLTPPQAGELLLKVRVVGLCGTDLFKLDNGSAAPGTVLGHELVGEVAAMGDGVTAFCVGDRVAVPHHVACGTCVLCRRGAATMCEAFKENLLAPGGFADHVLVRARATAHAARALPAHLADEVAVFMEPAACVLRGVRQAAIDPDGVAVVQGGGGMGLLHVLVLAAVHPRLRTLVVDPIEQRRGLACALGAEAAAAPGEDAHDALAEMTTGIGADAVFDTVGGAAPLDSALALTRYGGTVVLFAHAAADECAGFELNALFKHERRVLGSYSGGLDEQAQIFAMMSDGLLDPAPLVTHRLPLEDFAAGVAIARRREALKILFTP
jgi:L-iditol 2-dehydrogenase